MNIHKIFFVISYGIQSMLYKVNIRSNSVETCYPTNLFNDLRSTTFEAILLKLFIRPNCLMP